MTKEDIAYIAGLIDGEGSVLIGKSNRHYAKKYFRNPRVEYSLVVCIVNNNVGVLRWIQGLFTGFVNLRQNHSPLTRRPGYVWAIGGTTASNFLKKVSPYLRIKLKQAQLGIEFQKGKVRNQRGVFKFRVGEGELRKREKFYQRMKKLNQGNTEPSPSVGKV